MMRSRFTLVTVTLISFASAAHASQYEKSSDLLGLASRTLQVDGITDAKIVEVVENQLPTGFVFSYCLKGSPSLWRYEVLSSDGPDSLKGTRITKSQAVEADSKSCNVAG